MVSVMDQKATFGRLLTMLPMVPERQHALPKLFMSMYWPYIMWVDIPT